MLVSMVLAKFRMPINPIINESVPPTATIVFWISDTPAIIVLLDLYVIVGSTVVV